MFQTENFTKQKIKEVSAKSAKRKIARMRKKDIGLRITRLGSTRLVLHHDTYHSGHEICEFRGTADEIHYIFLMEKNIWAVDQ